MKCNLKRDVLKRDTDRLVANVSEMMLLLRKKTRTADKLHYLGARETNQAYALNRISCNEMCTHALGYT